MIRVCTKIDKFGSRVGIYRSLEHLSSMLGCAREKRRRRNSGNVPEHCERGRPVRGVSRVTTLRLSSGHTRIHTQQGMYDDERAEGTVISRCIVSRASPALYFYHTPTTRPGKRAPWPMYTAPDVFVCLKTWSVS